MNEREKFEVAAIAHKISVSNIRYGIGLFLMIFLFETADKLVSFQSVFAVSFALVFCIWQHRSNRKIRAKEKELFGEEGYEVELY